MKSQVLLIWRSDLVSVPPSPALYPCAPPYAPTTQASCHSPNPPSSPTSWPWEWLVPLPGHSPDIKVTLSPPFRVSAEMSPCQTTLLKQFTCSHSTSFHASRHFWVPDAFLQLFVVSPLERKLPEDRDFVLFIAESPAHRTVPGTYQGLSKDWSGELRTCHGTSLVHSIHTITNNFQIKLHLTTLFRDVS